MISLNYNIATGKKRNIPSQFYIVIKNLTIVFLLFTVTVAIVLLVAKSDFAKQLQ
jgi:hypothetical protein